MALSQSGGVRLCFNQLSDVMFASSSELTGEAGVSQSHHTDSIHKNSLDWD